MQKRDRCSFDRTESISQQTTDTLSLLGQVFSDIAADRFDMGTRQEKPLLREMHFLDFESTGMARIDLDIRIIDLAGMTIAAR